MRESNSVIKMLVAVLIVVLVSASLVGCLGGSEDQVTAIRQRGKLIVGTSSGFIPFEMVNGTTGKMEGFDIDIARMIANELNVVLEVRDFGFETLFGSVKMGTIDMAIAGVSITEERELAIDFSDPYFQADQAIVVLSTNDDINGPEDLDGVRIAVNLETTGDYWVTDNVDASDVLRYPFAYEVFLALQAGFVDAVVIDKPVADAYAAQAQIFKVVYTILTDESYGIVMQTGSNLVPFVNDVLANLVGSGEMEKIVAKWF